MRQYNQTPKKMLDKKAEGFRFSKKLEISEEDIDKSLIPILVFIEKNQNDFESRFELIEKNIGKKMNDIDHNIGLKMEESIVQLKKYEEVFKTKLQPIYCDKPSTAFFAGAGKASAYAVSIAIVFAIFSICWTIRETSNDMSFHGEKLSHVLFYDKTTQKYSIQGGDLIKEKNGSYSIRLP